MTEKPTSPQAKIDSSLRKVAGEKATEFLAENIGNHLRDANIPFEVDSVLMQGDDVYVDVRLGPVVRVRVTGMDESRVVFFDRTSDNTKEDSGGLG